jgi:hypothetical protein
VGAEASLIIEVFAGEGINKRTEGNVIVCKIIL